MFAKRALLSLLLVGGVALARTAPEPAVTPAPTEKQAETAAWVAQLLSNSRFHYQPLPLDDALSEKIYDRYLKSLDGDKAFLLASDVEAFSKYRESFDDALRDRQLQPAFDMFNTYVQRVGERTAFAREYLKGDNFDFTADESYDYDREDATYAMNSDELDALWKKRIKNDVLRLKLAGKDLPAIRDTLDKRYVNYDARVREINSEDVFQTFMNAYANAIEPHTAYMNPRTTENFNISMRLSLEGIGAVLQRNDEEMTVVRQVVPGGPAGLSGKLKVGDRIVGVGQGKQGPMTDVIGWRIDDVVDLIRGAKDTYVRLDVLPAEAGSDGPHEIVTLIRQKVKLEEQAAKKSIVEVKDGDGMRRIGIIELPTFYQDFEGRRRDEADYRSATRDVAKLIEELKADRVDGLVVDLRDNGGGSLTEAIELTGLFIDQGPVVQVRDSAARVQVESDGKSGTLWDGPLAVLTNRASASASEIFAAAIQDYGRGLIIGEPTFGKGTVQNLVDLDMFARGEKPGLGQLKLTVAQFFRIDGGSTQHKGVSPDIGFPVTLDAEDYGESSFDNALPWTQIKPATFETQADFKPLLPLLQAKHDTRAKADPEFRWWSEDVAEYRKQRAQTSISLNEATRRAERTAQETRRKEREAQRKAAGLVDDDTVADDVRDDGLQADERDIVAEAEREQKAREDDKPDALLREAAHVLADAIDLLSTDRSLAARVHPMGSDDARTD
ncbi:carboxy terminal-processing peptidase [Chiayiivirga flava]|uniref:Carboxyl-terminal processing protease n=1 Tax=Chiayiivirga flava TaxID=659595 RepID=A0A7W8D805_9GAMM|nr:carboxy terminal-processing peptidase [Chiayiivirga flava]MBB5209624.1 carboxyl-terminal processing protease [Chiayiivirga flava]